MNVPLVLLVVLGGLLVAAALEDARHREIANGKNVAIALLAPVWWWANSLSPWPDMAIQLGAAAIIFGVFVGMFAAGWMGGGDVKLIGALALWLPLEAMGRMLVVMSLAGGALTLLMMANRRLRRRATDAPIEVPYGVAIALAGLLALHEPILNHLSR